jgi:hypothetical protein
MRVFLILLLVVVVAVGGLGFYFGWWGFTKTRDAEGKATGVTFNVNQQRIAEDTKKAKTAIRNLGKKGQEGTQQEAKATQTVKGTLKKVEPAERRLTLNTAEKGSVTVQTVPDTKIRRNDVDVRVNELREGDSLEVLYRDENGKHVAESVTAKPGT